MEGAATPPQIKSQVVLIEITLNLRLCKDSESLNNLVNYLSYLIKIRSIMRYFKRAILIASAALCFNLSAFSQDITLKANNVTVKEAMEQLKKSSGYSFVFSSADVNTKKRISISVEDAGIEEVIKQILQGQSGFSYEIQGKKIIIKSADRNCFFCARG